MEIKTQSKIIKGIKISFKRSGQGSPFILIHTSHSYGKYFQKFNQKGKYQILTIDIPGYYSPSQKLAISSIGEFVDILAELFNRLKFKKINLLGECLGSVIVLKFAEKYPNRVKKLIVVSPPLKIFSSKIRKTLKPIFVFFKKYRLAGIFAKFLIRINLWRKITDFLGGYHNFWKIFNRETLLISKYNFDERVFWGVLADLFSIDIEKTLKKIKNRTLFVLGEKDKITKKQAIINLCQKRNNFSYLVIPQANHALVNTHTKEFHQAVENFLSNSGLPFESKN